MDKIFRDKKAILIFVLPAFILFTAVLLVPVVSVFYYSLFDFKDYAMSPKGGKFVGLKNFATLFTSDHESRYMLSSLKNSLFFMIFSAVTQQILGLLLAVLLTNIKKGRNFFKNIYYMPAILSSAALGLMWYFLVKNSFHEFLNENNSFLGISYPIWLIGAVATWQYVGQTMMLYMAQITGISPSLYEAAYIDGCGKVKAFRYVTLPLIKPMVATSLSLTCIGSLKFFDLVWVMFAEKNQPEVNVLATYLYRKGFRASEYDVASAIGVFLLGLSLLITFIVNKCIKVEEYEM